MHRNAHLLVINLILILTLAMLGLGCSGDRTIGPTNTVILENDVSAKPVVPEPTFVETFDKHSNVGNWSFFGNPQNHYEKIEPQGGNPGAFLYSAGLDTYAPKLRTEMGVSSIFSVDYR